MFVIVAAALLSILPASGEAESVVHVHYRKIVEYDVINPPSDVWGFGMVRTPNTRAWAFMDFGQVNHIKRQYFRKKGGGTGYYGKDKPHYGYRLQYVIESTSLDAYGVDKNGQKYLKFKSNAGHYHNGPAVVYYVTADSWQKQTMVRSDYYNELKYLRSFTPYDEIVGLPDPLAKADGTRACYCGSCRCRLPDEFNVKEYYEKDEYYEGIRTPPECPAPVLCRECLKSWCDNECYDYE